MITYRKVLFPEKQKALCVNDEIDDLNIPEGKFLIRTMYSQVSAGTERAIYRGQEAWFPLPGTPGYSCVGRVIAKSSTVADVEIGDIIFCRGKHAEYQYVDRDDNFCKVPERIDLKKAPIARLFAIAITGVRMSKIELGDDVLVVGQGLIGNAAAQLAQLQGANVLALDLDDGRLEQSKACGIAHMLNSGSENLMAKIMEIFDGRKPTTVIDATGVPKVIDDSIDYVAPDGRLVLLGSPRGEYIGNITHFQQHIHRFAHRVEVIGAHEQMSPRKAMPYVKHSCQRNERICLELIADGKLKVDTLITNVVPPEDCEIVYSELDKNNPAYLGVVFDWTK